MTYGVVPRKLCALLRKQMTVYFGMGAQAPALQAMAQTPQNYLKKLKYGIFLDRYTAAFVR